MARWGELVLKYLFFIFFPLLIKVKTCKPALGYSFAAGTIDGVGAFNFTQGNLGSRCQYGFIQMGRTWGIPQIDSNPQIHLRTSTAHWTTVSKGMFLRKVWSYCPLASLSVFSRNLLKKDMTMIWRKESAGWGLGRRKRWFWGNLSHLFSLSKGCQDGAQLG